MNRKNLTAAILAILFGLAGLFGIVGSAQAMDQCMTGAWYSPDKDGEGIELTVLDDSLYGYLYTYKGTSPDWYVFAGPFGKNKVNLYKPIKTSNPWKATVHEVGTMGYDVIDDNHITFTMKLQMDLWRDVTFPLCLLDCTRVFEYERLTELPQIPCLN